METILKYEGGREVEATLCEILSEEYDVFCTVDNLRYLSKNGGDNFFRQYNGDITHISVSKVSNSGQFSVSAHCVDKTVFTHHFENSNCEVGATLLHYASMSADRKLSVKFANSFLSKIVFTRFFENDNFFPTENYEKGEIIGEYCIFGNK